MSWSRALVFVSIFCVDVHVKAAELCWQRKGACAVEASSSRQVVKDDSLIVSLAKNSLIERRVDGSVQVVRGKMYVSASRPVVFGTPYARMWCEGECKGILVREPAQIQLKSLGGRWLIQRTGDKETYALPEGMQTSFGEVMEDGAAAMEFPQSLPWNSIAKEWLALYPGKEFKKELAEFRVIWRKAVENASSMHKVEASRTIASHENELAAERARAAEREREDAALRRLFREKNP